MWIGDNGSLIGRPMLVGLDGADLTTLRPPPKIAGARVDPVPALYLP
jgi:hypothetical protein